MGLKIVTFDTETTGVDTENDRIITCFMRAKEGNEVVFEKDWTIDPGVEVPEEASEVHGMTTEWVKENGRKDVAESISEIVEELETFVGYGYTVGGYNHSFDLAMLDAEIRRSGHVLSGLSLPGARYIDPLVLDRHIDRYRKGGRKLMDVALHYGIMLDDERLHEAQYDVEVTEKLIPKLLNATWNATKSERPEQTPDEFITWLQDKQEEWKREWAEGITKYFAKINKTEDDGSPIVVEGRFPW